MDGEKSKNELQASYKPKKTRSLEEKLSKAKNLEEPAFDAKTSLVPPKFIKNYEKLNSEIVKN